MVGSGGGKEEVIRNYNFKKELVKNNKIDNKFCDQLHSLTLEELITLKLQLATENLKGKFYGFPVIKFVNNIVKESLVRFAISSTDSYREAAKVLGLSHVELYTYIKKHNLLNKED